ncbi:hypothetical protein OA344_00390 [Pseudomonadota bacterium]|nr:hypothetical protein [Pseudomonadota bacterium]MDC3067205.1 hypothetical protein [Pseudomonadota bacterium]
MRLILTLICFSVCSQICFSATATTERIFMDYRINLEKLSPQSSKRGELFISVFKGDLPVTKLLLTYEGIIGEYLVMDIDNNNSFEIILLFENTLKNIRIFTMKLHELIELTIGNQDLTNKNTKFIKIEKEGDDIYRTLEVFDGEQIYLQVQKFCFREQQWCEYID